MAQSSRSRSRKRGRRRGNRALSVGVIQVTRKGYAFVDTPEGEYFILRGYLYGAMNGDLVEVVRMRRLEEQRRGSGGAHRSGENNSGQRGMVGSVRRVLERAHITIVGVVRETDGLFAVIPDDERIHNDLFLGRARRGPKVKDGDVVVARITTYPSKIETMQGYIEEILGREDEHGVDMAMVIRSHGLETEFSPQALAEANELAAHLPQRDEFDDLVRQDIRDRFIFTIDPEDARDFDDALSIEYVDGVLRLGVHIADVSSYLAWDGAIDVNARRRTTSVYLPDRVIPMLPPVLSDDLCSLKPHLDRRAFTVDMYLRKDGVVDYAKFYPSLIHSAARLTYQEVQEILEGLKTPLASEELIAKLAKLNKLAKKRAHAREQRGAIDFESAEPKVVLNEHGMPEHVYVRTKTDATSLVEEAMILANETVAQYLLAHKEPCIYRIHDEPLAGALEEILPTLQEFGYGEQGPPQSSKEIQSILLQSKDKAEYTLLSTLLLRAMKRAQYHTVFTTHFGLASQAYVHFTSPIRRYPDLMVHRLLKLRLRAEQEGFESVPAMLKERPHSTYADMITQLDWICEHCSDGERVADQATYDALKIKLCEFFATRLGTSYQGIVSGTNTYGLYVREETTRAEGFVARDALDDGFVYEPARHRWLNHSTGKGYRLGQPITVTLASVNLARRELEFVLK